jgi:hypothetical protein
MLANNLPICFMNLFGRKSFLKTEVILFYAFSYICLQYNSDFFFLELNPAVFLWIVFLFLSKVPLCEATLTILWPPELAGFQCKSAQLYYKGPLKIGTCREVSYLSVVSICCRFDIDKAYFFQELIMTLLR